MTDFMQFEVPFTFARRPTPLTGDLRPAWRMSLVLLILHHSRGKKASFRKLHALNSCSRSAASSSALLSFLQGQARGDEIIPRVEPSLNRAVNLLRGEGLVEIENGRNIKLTDRGAQAAQQLDEADDCLIRERAFLKEVKPLATEVKIDSLFRWGSS